MSTSTSNGIKPRRTINDLPIELKKEIVELCAEQDERFREWVAKDAEPKLKIASQLKINKSMHGKSVSALFRVSKEFSALAAPHLFQARLFPPFSARTHSSLHPMQQTLKSNQIDLTFKCLVAPAHLESFRTLEITTAEQPSGLLPFLPYLSKIKHFVINPNTLEALWGWRPVNFDTAELLEPACYAAAGMRCLTSVEEISARQVELSSLCPVVKVLSNSLTSLHLRLTCRRSSGFLSQTICNARNLKRLSIDCIDDSTHRVLNLGNISPSLTSATVPPVEHFSVSAFLLHSSHLSSLSIFASTLREVSLTSSLRDNGESEWVVQPTFSDEVFPHVQTLSFSGEETLLNHTLASVTSKTFPALSTAKLDLSNVRDWADDFSPLDPFAALPSLKTLYIADLSKVARDERQELALICSENGIALRDFPSSRPRPPPPGPSTASSTSETAKNLRETLEYIEEQLKKAKEGDDTGLFSRIKGALQPFERERIANEVWEKV
ncbi:hypothetical protein JCM8547_001054 [Rhodosporidiobolus lusitaniae]